MNFCILSEESAIFSSSPDSFPLGRSALSRNFPFTWKITVTIFSAAIASSQSGQLLLWILPVFPMRFQSSSVINGAIGDSNIKSFFVVSKTSRGFLMPFTLSSLYLYIMFTSSMIELMAVLKLNLWSISEETFFMVW